MMDEHYSEFMKIEMSKSIDRLFLKELLNDKMSIAMSNCSINNIERVIDKELYRIWRRMESPYYRPLKQQLRLHHSDDMDRSVAIVKIFVPTDVFPDFNFMGKLLGPKGKILKQLESITNCKILIRGKGSSRNKQRNSNKFYKDEPLHLIITAEGTHDTVMQTVDSALCKIRPYLEPDIDENEYVAAVRNYERNQRKNQNTEKELQHSYLSKPINTTENKIIPLKDNSAPVNDNTQEKYKPDSKTPVLLKHIRINRNNYIPNLINNYIPKNTIKVDKFSRNNVQSTPIQPNYPSNKVNASSYRQPKEFYHNNTSLMHHNIENNHSQYPPSFHSLQHSTTNYHHHQQYTYSNDSRGHTNPNIYYDPNVATPLGRNYNYFPDYQYSQQEPRYTNGVDSNIHQNVVYAPPPSSYSHPHQIVWSQPNNAIYYDTYQDSVVEESYNFDRFHGAYRNQMSASDAHYYHRF